MFVSSTYKGGYLRETELVPKTIGPIGAIQQIPFALQLARAGKVPNPLAPHKAKDNAEVKRLWKLIESQTPKHKDRATRGARGSLRMKDRYAYYPGCLASLSQKELDSSSRAIMGLLGAELVEMPSVTCCGAGDIHEAKPDYYLHISARILGQAERSGCDTILTICNVCTLNLRQANERLKENPAELARINDNLKQTGIGGYEGGVDVRHLLWEVSQGDGYERFKEVAVKSLEGLKVAPFYGCQILRPAKLLGFEDPDRPESLERLIEACGAEAIDYPAKIKCCGFPIVLAREDVALGELVQPLQQATDAGADVMVTPCPLCHLSLDAWQKKAAGVAGQEFNLPVLHLAQLLGAAAGIDESTLKFKRHIVRLSDDVKEKLKLPSVISAD